MRRILKQYASFPETFWIFSNLKIHWKGSRSKDFFNSQELSCIKLQWRTNQSDKLLKKTPEFWKSPNRKILLRHLTSWYPAKSILFFFLQKSEHKSGIFYPFMDTLLKVVEERENIIEKNNTLKTDQKTKHKLEEQSSDSFQ